MNKCEFPWRNGKRRKKQKTQSKQKEGNRVEMDKIENKSQNRKSVRQKGI